MDLQTKINEWKKTRSVSLAAEICEHLSKRMISDELFKQVVDWGRDKGITNSQLQMCKVQEEVGEAAHELVRGHGGSEEMQDAIGDIIISTIILADILNFDALFCLQESYDTIKPRTGKTIDGCFVKEENLK